MTDDVGMTAIRTKCPTCGDVKLAAHDLSLYLTPAGDRGSYSFICPECSSEVDRPASRKTVSLLIAAGVEPASRGGLAPAVAADALPLGDRSPDAAAPPFTTDDLIAFHFLLEDDAAIAEQLGG